MFQQMTPSAAEFLKKAGDDPTKRMPSGGFNPRSLVDVFKHTNPSLYVETLKDLLFGQNKLQLGTIYYHLSQLPVAPVADTWTTWVRSLPTPTSLLSALSINDPMDLASWPVIASYDQSRGHVDSKLDLLRRIIARGTKIGIGPLDSIFDYAKLQKMLGRPTEAANALRQFMCLRETCSEEEIARKYAANYVWSQKAYVSTMGHERYEEARKLS
jgi:hypothetical protein